MRRCCTLALLVVVAAAACGQPSLARTRRPPHAPAGASSDPCSLLHTVDVEDATGSPVKSVQRAVPKRQSHAGLPLCVYDLSKPFGAITVYLNERGAQEFAERFETTDDPSTERLDDVGDRAYLRGGTGAAALVGEVYVGVGTQYYTDKAPIVVTNLLRQAVASLS